MRQFEPPARASPRFCRDNLTKAPKSRFELPQPFAGPIRPAFVAELSECTIDDQKFPFLISHSIQFRFSALIHPMMCRGA
jgi:hypothetical protein